MKRDKYADDVRRVATQKTTIPFADACALMRKRRITDPGSGGPTSQEKEALIVIAMEWRRYGRITKEQALALMKGDDPPPGRGSGLS